MLHFASRVPTFAVERPLRIRALAELRRELPDPPSWHALITKGLGLASMRVPELRRAYMPYPWPTLYEAPYSVASIVFEREFRSEDVPFFAPLLHPERLSLTDIRDKVLSWKRDPVHCHGALRRLIRTAKAPIAIRRLLWSIGLYGNGYFRARNFGTFAVNSVRSLGLNVKMFSSPLTSVWYYGNVTDAGEMAMSMGLDHRVFDGNAVARAFRELEDALNGELLKEARNPTPQVIEARLGVVEPRVVPVSREPRVLSTEY